ncbi:hypothetical protein J31TS4_03990 [Paenibacillus sp. J31TS4]|uniref:hypothetical protein n=1 Tax=Paenibacillus sp. J31TS4 TaxID=2807195 RepID=UPI001B27CFBA|nr:hypothetical protein [Paenibacillus sp. J31TS4]GIP37119.1 hypothetical protein J31TS4_03990 [Paenibacillus sp. J31TS4]
MKIKEARNAAMEWVQENALRLPGFLGAYISGSTVGMPEEAELPATSDVDIVLVTEDEEPQVKPGKFLYMGVLLEVSYLPASQLASAEQVLSAYQLAGSFRVDTVLADPTGWLGRLQRQVSEQFAARSWVLRRCEHAWRKSRDGLRGVDQQAPLPDRSMGWLFSTGVMTHVVLAASLRNPTVRLRYLAAREVLEQAGRLAFYEELLERLGCAHLSPERVERHLTALERTFDTAAAVSRTPFFFRSDIRPDARPIAIDGSRALIRSGFHREAVFWIAATYCRCHKILDADAPETGIELLPAFEALLDDLGVLTIDSLAGRREDNLRFLPKLWELAEALVEANPAVRNE